MKKRIRRKIKITDKGFYRLNKKCSYLNELRNFVLKLSPPPFPEIGKGLKALGEIKLAIASGNFLNLKDARVDLMVVGDDIDFKRFSGFIKKLESEAGEELRYVVLGTEEFKYRYRMFDRFVRDILEYPHRKVIDKLKMKN